MRWGILIASLALLLFTAPASSRTVEYGYRPGGVILTFVIKAHMHLGAKDTLVITGDQKSAAAMQVVIFKRIGGSICFKGRRVPWLHFHQPYGPRKVGVKDYKSMFRILMGPEVTRKIGNVTVHKYKRFPITDFGIRRCKIV